MAIWSKEVFAKNLRYYMDKNGRTQKELAEIVGVSAPTMSDYLKGKKYPRIDKIEIMADYFGILKSDLIEEKTKEHKEMQKNNDILSDVADKLIDNPSLLPLFQRMLDDPDFLSLVEALFKYDTKKIVGVKQMLDSFQ